MADQSALAEIRARFESIKRSAHLGGIDMFSRRDPQAALIPARWDDIEALLTIVDGLSGILAAQEAERWFPIASAPRGSNVLVACVDGVYIAFCSIVDGAWCDHSDVRLTFTTRDGEVEYDWLPMRSAPTHWRPLPASPKESPP